MWPTICSNVTSSTEHNKTSDGLISQDKTSDSLITQDKTSDDLFSHDKTSDGLISQDKTSDGLISQDKTSDIFISQDKTEFPYLKATKLVLSKSSYTCSLAVSIPSYRCELDSHIRDRMEDSWIRIQMLKENFVHMVWGV